MIPATLRELFDQALALPVAQRDGWLDRHCTDPAMRARLRRLLEAARDATESAAFAPAAQALARAIGDIAPPPPGTRIGPFELIERLGEGGHAAVYRALREQHGVRQSVALKLLHGSLHAPQAQRQFRREREALAQLQHPNIARLIEGGVSDSGRAYIALELVEGRSIVEHAESLLLDPPRRIALFLQVCRAVEAAHRALIVHRDLKPSNILVTAEGQVKLLDFGIAKLLDDASDDARTQLPAFTPAYAAPEQRDGGAITTSTDVYALGVVLTELLGGGRPGAQAASPPPVRGDLALVLRKASDPDPLQRYASAGALAEDLERHLQGRPVLAHPPSRRYRLRRFLQRQRWPVAAGSVLVLALLLAFGSALWQADVARREAQRANAVRDFLVQLFDAASARLPRDQRPSAADLVAQARRRLDGPAAPDPRTRADVLVGLGRIELSMSDFSGAKTSLARAIALLEGSGDPDALRAARVLQADAHQRAGENAEAIAQLEPMLATLRAAPDDTLEHALAVLAAARMATGAPDAALAARHAAVRHAAQRLGPDAPEAIAARFALGSTLAETARTREAIAELEAALAQWRRIGGPEDERYVGALAALAAATDNSGDAPLTVARLQELLALKQRIYEAPHASLAETLRNLAIVQSRSGRIEDALPNFEQALAMQRALYGAEHEEIALTRSGRGVAYARERRFAEAMDDYRAALAICERARLRSEMCTRSRNNLGQSLYRQGDLDAARREMEIALRERRETWGARHATVAVSLSTLANVRAAQGDGDGAVALADEALGILREHGLEGTRDGVLLLNTRAQALHVAGRDADALPEIERSLAMWRRISPEQRAREATMLALKAQIERALARAAEARATALAALALRVPADELSAATRASLRELSGRSDAYPAGASERP